MLRSSLRIAVVALAIAQLPAGAAEDPLGPVEQAIESNSSVTILPATAPSTVSVASCFECVPKYLHLESSTQYFIGKHPVTLADLKKAIATSAGVGLYVFFEPKSKVINRVVADASLLPTEQNKLAQPRKPRA